MSFKQSNLLIIPTLFSEVCSNKLKPSIVFESFQKLFVSNNLLASSTLSTVNETINS